MRKYEYLIIGGGMAADAAVHGIREVDANGTIGLVSVEPDPPYNRPPLTKGLWKGESIESVWRDTSSQHVEMHLGRRARQLDPKSRTVTDDQGDTYAYAKLLLATGGTPRRLGFGDEQVLYFRTLSDYRRLRAMADGKRRLAVIGGGFIGSELAAALTTNGNPVIMAFPGKGICHRLFPDELSRYVTQYYRGKGVEVWPGETISALDRHGQEIVLKAQSGRETAVDGVVAGLGIEPNTDLARSAGLAVQDGVLVDEGLRTSEPDIFAAGDVASFFSPALGERTRVEHEDNANTMGRLAGRNMAGQSERYEHLPFFYSDLFDLGYEAVGELNAELQTVVDWKEPCREGVIYYLREGRVRGVLLWNVWNQVDAARELIKDHQTHSAEDLRQKLPQAA